MSNRIRSSFVGAGLLATLLFAGLGGCALDPKDRALIRGDYVYIGGFRELGRPQKLRVPDLRPRSGSSFVQGDDVFIEIKMRNQGDGHSDPFNVVAQVTVPSTAAGQPARVVSFTIPFSDLDPGEDQSVYTGAVTVPLADRPVDLSVQVTADPPTPGHPRGDVFEWDESNNVRVFTQRIF